LSSGELQAWRNRSLPLRNARRLNRNDARTVSSLCALKLYGALPGALARRDQ
jgi:hypothetical protein